MKRHIFLMFYQARAKNGAVIAEGILRNRTPRTLRGAEIGAALYLANTFFGIHSLELHSIPVTNRLNAAPPAMLLACPRKNP